MSGMKEKRERVKAALMDVHVKRFGRAWENSGVYDDLANAAIAVMQEPEPDPEKHRLIITPAGGWNCSCLQWGDSRLGPLTGEHCISQGITEQTVRAWHASHANAIRIEV